MALKPEEISNILQKEIEGKQYDICCECWNPLAERLKGKGRVNTQCETVFLPSPTREPEQEVKPVPGEPPKIWSAVDWRH